MVNVTDGALSPYVTGIVICGTIDACQAVYEVRRAGEWTDALTRWCDGQPDLVAFTGNCLIHRAELMQLRGAWPAALAEAHRAGVRLPDRGPLVLGGRCQACPADPPQRDQAQT